MTWKGCKEVEEKEEEQQRIPKDLMLVRKWIHCVQPDSQNMKVGLGCMAKSGKYNHFIWLELRALDPFLQG